MLWNGQSIARFSHPTNLTTDNFSLCVSQSTAIIRDARNQTICIEPITNGSKEFSLGGSRKKSSSDRKCNVFARKIIANVIRRAAIECQNISQQTTDLSVRKLFSAIALPNFDCSHSRTDYS